ncbi:MAG: Si-specific NAD(P)(+) transhydrogenase [Acidobacteria bacterium]|nr:MAG: Si-specific NAD(P)(+) transhydrogenase [Acidobacteriota bacterium]
MEDKYDVIVIGSGPGGEGAAMKCAKEGKTVAIIDDFSDVGGKCTHLSTIPSKALLHSVRQLAYRGKETNDFSKLLKNASEIIQQQVKLRSSFYLRNHVDTLTGFASFINENTLEISRSDMPAKKVQADAFVIATGARPYRPKDVDFNHPRVLDSDTVLSLKKTPRSITIYGAGVIGCEYASIFRGSGIKVNLINSRDRLLSFLDEEISNALGYHLREHGAKILHNEEYERVECNDDDVTVHLKSNKQVHSRYLLWVQGRTGNSDRMGLKEIGIETDSRGYIKVNESYQTQQSHIYAVGDVVGYPSLASAAYDQGRFAANHLVFGSCDDRLVERIPIGIYTIPEISSIGATEQDLTEAKVPYEVGHAFFKHLARAQILGQTTGMLKILFHRESFEILGVHCFGANATEIIHIGQAIISQSQPGNNLMYFINTTFNYPTMAEAYRVAALNGINRIKF